jgi:type II secretory pathway component PulM
MRGGVQMYVRNTSRRRGLSALAVVGSCLGVYIVLAMAFHWFVEPSVAKIRAVAPYQPPPAAMMQAATPVAPPAPAARFAATSATPATDASAPAEPADKPADATPKKPAREQAARTARVWNPIGSPNGW